MLTIDYDKLQISSSDLSGDANPLTLNVMGDFAPIYGNISHIVRERGEQYFTAVKPYLNDAYNIINLETVIDTQKRPIHKFAPRFIDKPETLQPLTTLPIHLACLAHNHIMDNGKEGLDATIKHLTHYGIDHTGASNHTKQIYHPFIIEKNGQKIAIINTAEGEEANEQYNEHWGAADITSHKVIDTIRACKQKGYLVIIIAHAGVEFIPTPPPHICHLYKSFVDEGANLIIAHHLMSYKG